MNKLSLAEQIGVLVFVLALTGVWLLTPERGEAVLHSAQWYSQLVRNLADAQDPASVLLEPISRGDRSPLVTFEEVAFAGCDLGMRGRQLYLVTTWLGRLQDTGLEARLAYVAGGEMLASDQWSLDSGEHYSRVPSQFFSRHGISEVRLTVIDGASGRSVAPTASSLPTFDVSVQICK